MDHEQEDIIIYNTVDGTSHVELLLRSETAWMTQKQLSELFETSIANINTHIKNITEDGELDADTVTKSFLVTATDGKTYDTQHYNLDMVLAIGYRVRSSRGVEFRKWANTVLKEYLVKGFAMDDARLKDGGDAQYFKELLSRIRDIRSSEKVFYRQVLDIFVTSIDYDKNSPIAQNFFKSVQNKLHYAIHGMTAAELINVRADAELPFMGLTTFSGSTPHLKDTKYAKNYLTQKELQELNLLVSGYLDLAELRANSQRTTTMSQWEKQLEGFLALDDREVLQGYGRIRHNDALKKAQQEYTKFNIRRQQEGLSQAERDFLDTIKKLEDTNKQNK